jgi:DegV family protein with EDD domain
MKVGIVTDSTSDLPSPLAEQHGIEVVPSILIIDGRQYADGQGLSRTEFYARLADPQGTPTTAAPSIGQFKEKYQALFAGGCAHVISIHAAGALTSILDTAVQAAREFDESVTVVDSGSLSLGLGFQVLAAAQAAESGLEASLAAVESTRRRLHVQAALDTLQYAKRSGRVPATLSAFGAMLRLKPVIELAGGEITAIRAARTAGQATERVAKFFDSEGPFERLAIMHSGAERRAREFLDRIMRDHGQALPREILLVNVTPVIGLHVGPGALGFAAVEAEPERGKGSPGLGRSQE